MAWWVVVGHALHLLSYTPESYPTGAVNIILRFLTRGHTAVDVFIIVSGFVIAHLIATKKEEYLPYIIRRWFRIFPIFIICIFIAMIIRPLYLEAYTEYSWVYAADMRLERAALETGPKFWEHFLLHFSMLHGVVPEEVLKYASSSILAPGWSLSLEWQFYILAPFIIFLLRKNVIVGLTTCLGALCLWYVATHQSEFTWMYPSFLPLSIQYFLIGISSRFLMEKSERGVLKFFWVFVLAISALFADWLSLVIWGATFIAITSETGMIKLPYMGLRIKDFVFGDSFVRVLGQWSYSTYLVHILLFSIVVGGFSILAGGGISHMTAVFLVGISLVLTIPISWVSYTYIERPFARFGSKVAASIAANRSLNARTHSG